MSDAKTKPTDISVDDFLAGIGDVSRRAECHTLLEIMKDITGAEPRMWGPSMVGFGEYHYKYASGREGDWFVTGFSPRSRNLTIYLMTGFEPHKDLMESLGKHKTGKSCLYVKRLTDVDLDVLRQLIRQSVQFMEARGKSA